MQDVNVRKHLVNERCSCFDPFRCCREPERAVGPAVADGRFYRSGHRKLDLQTPSLQTSCRITAQSSIGPQRHGPAVFSSIHRAGRGHSPLNASPACYDPPSCELLARPPPSFPCEQVFALYVRPSSTAIFVASVSRPATPTLSQTRHWRTSSRDGRQCHLRSRRTCGWL